MNVSQCYATGDVDATAAETELDAGGFVGYVSVSATFTNCYARGDVCADGTFLEASYIGGFLGTGTVGTFTNSYSTGEVLDSSSAGGGFAGDNTGPTATECYWDTETSGWETSGLGTGKTTTEMMNRGTFDAWDLDFIWWMETLGNGIGGAPVIWLSEVDDYENFEEGVKDADSFTVTVPTGNRLRWVKSLEYLLIGTTGDEWRLSSSKLDIPLTPTNYILRQQTDHGSNTVQPITTRSVIMFVGNTGRQLFELTFDGDKYISTDMTSLAEHITASGIVCAAQQRHPDSILWCVLADGSLLSFTYDRQQNVTAWAKHPIDGTVQSVCVIPNASAGEDEVWISVGRTVNSVDVTYIERLTTRVTATLASAFFVDSGLTWSGTASNTLTAAHLVGETVSVLGTLAGVTTLYEDLTVAAGGTITLPDSATVTSAIFGLPFTAKVQPMRLVVNTPEGTSMGSITKVSELVLSLMDSCNVKYGAVDTDLYDVGLAAPELENSSEITGCFSGDIALAHPGGFSVQSPIIVVSSDPTPFNLRAIVARMEQSGR